MFFFLFLEFLTNEQKKILELLEQLDLSTILSFSRFTNQLN